MEYPQFRTAVEALYNALSTAQTQADAQSTLMRVVNESPNACDLGRAALRDENPQVRFFGALTLNLILLREPGPPAETYLSIQHALLETLASENFPFVATKICVAITSLAFKAIPSSSWPRPILSLHSLFLSPESPNSRTISAPKILLSLYTVFAQELASYSFGIPAHRVSVFESVRSDISKVILLIEQVLGADLAIDAGSADQTLVDLKLEALKCVLAWCGIEKGIPADSMPRILSLVTAHLQFQQTFQTSCQVLADLLTTPFTEKDVETAHAFCTLVSQIGESFPKYVVKNLTGASTPTLHLVEMVLAFTGFPGYYGVDEDLTHIPDQFWYEIQETLIDDTVIPMQKTSIATSETRPDLTTDPVTHEPVIHGDGIGFDGTRIATRFLSRSSTLGGWDMSGFPDGAVDRIWSISREIFSTLVKVLCVKVARPSEKVLFSWDLDLREKFRVYRHDKSEVLLSCHRILGGVMYDILVPIAVRQISEIREGLGEDGQALEATLFCIKSIAEEVHLNNTPQLHTVFGNLIMGQIASFPPLFWRIRLTFCLVIGEARHPYWLNKNPQYLLPVITFLMNSLNVSPHVTTAAIHALEQVCSTCRKQLGHVAKDMLDAWERLKNGLASIDRIRLIRAVSSILEPLTPQDQLPHLMRLTGSMVSEIRANLSFLAASPALLSQPAEVEVAERMLIRDLLRLLNGICQGIRSSEDGGVGSDDDEISAMSQQEIFVDVDTFDIDSIDITMKTNLMQLSDVVWETIGAVFQVFQQDEETIDIACGLIIMTLDTNIPVMFTPNPTRLATLLIQSFSANKFPIILRAVNILIQSVRVSIPNAPSSTSISNQTILVVGSKAVVREWVSARVREINEITFQLLINDGGMNERPDLIEYYFKLLTKVLDRHPWALIQLPQEHQNIIFGTLLHTGMALNERASCTAVFDFVRDLVSFKNASEMRVLVRGKKRASAMQAESEDAVEAAQCKELLNGAVRSIGVNVVQVLFADIGSGLPTSMWPMIADLLHRIIHYFPNEAKGWVITCLQVDGFPTKYCTKTDKEDFVKGMMVAQMKAFKDLVKKFGLKCRNLQDTSYGSAIRVY
ncbi:hypothetical protein HK100_006230 [Physocladia obscura]|uniref:Uncharacterized protein n=1 Tax=Physocladia obscura TaxID=109957 RepID=A0AAD5XMM1_9FUNG|nr:hypothetical protein HK100_006230 [Physocladia obscura]